MTASLALRCRYMALALKLNASVLGSAEPTAAKLRDGLEKLRVELGDSDDALSWLVQSALVCAGAMADRNVAINVPGLHEPAKVTPSALMRAMTRSDVMLLTTQAAYNLACAQAALLPATDDPIAVSRLQWLLGRAVDQETLKAHTRSDPFFNVVSDADWFVELLGPDPKSELESTWLTAPYAKALAPTKDLLGLRERLKTDTGLAGVLHVSPARLQEWADLLAIQGVPMSSLELLDRLAVRSPEALAAQGPTSLHLALKELGGTQKHDDVVTWVRTAQPPGERTS